MTVILLRTSLLSTLQKKLFAHFFDETAHDYVISHVTFYPSKHADHPLLVYH